MQAIVSSAVANGKLSVKHPIARSGIAAQMSVAPRTTCPNGSDASSCNVRAGRLPPSFVGRSQLSQEPQNHRRRFWTDTVVLPAPFDLEIDRCKALEREPLTVSS